MEWVQSEGCCIRHAMMRMAVHCRRDQPEAVREALVPALVRGYAAHHAGLLPGFKGLIEGLFQRGAGPSPLLAPPP